MFISQSDSIKYFKFNGNIAFMGSYKKGATIRVEKSNYHWHGQHGLRSSGNDLLVCDAQLILILTPGEAGNALLLSDARFFQILIPSNALADALLIGHHPRVLRHVWHGPQAPIN